MRTSIIINDENPDPFFNNVSLLLLGNGTNGSTTILDSSPSPKSVSAVGSAQISTAQSKRGGASIAFDGNGYLSIPLNSAFQFGLEDFTIEAWVYIASLGIYHAILEGRSIASFANFLFGVSNISGTLRLDHVNSVPSMRLTGSSTSIPLNSWTHAAWVRNSGTISCYVNGVKDFATQTFASAMNPSSSTLRIGAVIDPAWFNGYIDNLRITKGIARYTDNFTPPTDFFLD